MARTVKVDVDLGGTAKEGLEGLAVTVTIVDEKVEGLNRSLKGTERDAAKAAAAMKLLGMEADDAGNMLNRFGNKVSVVSELDKAIAHTRGEVVKLTEEFDRTGNIDIFKDMRKAKGDLNAFESLHKEISGTLKNLGEDGGKSFFSGFSSALNGLLSTPVLGPLSVGLIAGIVAALLPALNGAFLALGGMSGLALGIVGQLKNPDIHKAFTDVVTDLETTLAEATISFASPIVDSMKALGQSLKGAIGSIDFENLSKSLEPLIAGLGALVTNMMPGFNKMLVASGPLIDTLSDGLAQLGTAASDMFEMFAMGGHGAQEALKAVLFAIAGGLVAIGAIVLAASKAFEVFVAVVDDVAPVLEKVFSVLAKVPLIGTFFTALEKLASGVAGFFHALRDPGGNTEVLARNIGHIGAAAVLTDDQLSALNDKLNATKVTADTLAAGMTAKLFNAMMSVDQGILAVHQSLTAVNESFKENGKNIEINTAKGQANIQAVLGQVTSNMSLYQAQVAAGMSAADAAANYNTNTEALKKQLHQAGLTEAEIQSLIGKYENVPDEVNTAIKLQGLTDAINNLGNLIAKINGLDGRNFGFTVTETLVTADNRSGARTRGDRWGGIHEHAEQGLLSAGIYSPASPARYAFAEPATGGEGFVPRMGNYQRSTAIIDQEARWYGGRFAPGLGGSGHSGAMVNMPVTVNAGMGADGVAIGRQIANVLIPFVRANGGNVQAVLGAI